MAKAPTKSFTLQRGRTQPFHRTITFSKKVVRKDEKTGKQTATIEQVKKPVHMVFEPDVDYELTEEEQAFLVTEISNGLLVPTNRDAKGRQKTDRSEQAPEAAEQLASLQSRVDELEAANAKLTKDLADATKPKT